MRLLKSVLAASMLFLLAGCEDDIDLVFDPFLAAENLSVPGTPPNANLVGLDSSGTKLVRFHSTSPGIPAATVDVAGLQAGQTLVGIDFRAHDTRLYGLGYDPATGAMQLYSLEVASGGATPIGSTGGPPVEGDAFGFDFDPSTDRARVVNTAGQTFRIDPVSGEMVDGDPNTPGIQMDSAVPSMDGAAYAGPSLYTLDAGSDRLYHQGNALPLLVGGAPLDFDAQNGFDIAPNGGAFAALQANGSTMLFSINLASGTAIPLGAIGFPLRGLSVQL